MSKWKGNMSVLLSRWVFRYRLSLFSLCCLWALMVDLMVGSSEVKLFSLKSAATEFLRGKNSSTVWCAKIKNKKVSSMQGWDIPLYWNAKMTFQKAQSVGDLFIDEGKLVTASALMLSPSSFSAIIYIFFWVFKTRNNILCLAFYILVIIQIYHNKTCNNNCTISTEHLVSM